MVLGAARHPKIRICSPPRRVQGRSGPRRWALAGRSLSFESFQPQCLRRRRSVPAPGTAAAGAQEHPALRGPGKAQAHSSALKHGKITHLGQDVWMPAPVESQAEAGACRLSDTELGDQRRARVLQALSDSSSVTWGLSDLRGSSGTDSLPAAWRALRRRGTSSAPRCNRRDPFNPIAARSGSPRCLDALRGRPCSIGDGSGLGRVIFTFDADDGAQARNRRWSVSSSTNPRRPPGPGPSTCCLRQSVAKLCARPGRRRRPRAR